MVILLNAKTQLTKGSTLGMLEIPPLENGEEKELNDFQWVLPTSDWKKWVESTGRTWQAESSEIEVPFLNNLKESIVLSFQEGDSKGFRISSFDEFVNEEENSKNPLASSSAISELSDEESERATQYDYALGRLRESGGISNSLNTDQLGSGENAVLLSLPESSEGKQFNLPFAYKFVGKGSSEKFVYVSIEDVEPFGEINPQMSFLQNLGEIMKKAAGFLASASPFLVGAAIVYGGGKAASFGLSKLGLMKRTAKEGGKDLLDSTGKLNLENVPAELKSAGESYRESLKKLEDLKNTPDTDLARMEGELAKKQEQVADLKSVKGKSNVKDIKNLESEIRTLESSISGKKSQAESALKAAEEALVKSKDAYGKTAQKMAEESSLMKFAKRSSMNRSVMKEIGEFPDDLKDLGFFGRYLKGAQKIWREEKGINKFLKLGSKAFDYAFSGGKALKYTATGTKIGAGLAKFGGPQAIITVLVEAGWRTANWFSNNQAPRFGELEGKVPNVKDSFKPGDYKVGEAITICWTQESDMFGSVTNAVAGLLGSNDTRTVMSLIKIGDTAGQSLFVPYEVNSKSMNQEFSKVQLPIIAFSSGANFEHGWIDNDDIEYVYYPIKDLSPLTANMTFEGFLPWSTLISEINSSPKEKVKTSENAPKDFYFNYLDKDGKRINVKGTLVPESSAPYVMPDIPASSESSSGGSSSSSSSSGSSASKESGSVYFGEAPVKTGKSDGYQEKGEGIKDSLRVKSYGQFLNEEEDSKGSDSSFITGPVKANIYQAYYIENKSTGNIQPSDKSFFDVPDQYLDAEDGESIKISRSNLGEIRDPKKGEYIPEKEKEETKKEEEKKEEPIKTEEPKKELPSEEKVSLKDRGKEGTGVLKIKDKDKEDGWNPAQSLSNEEKAELGIQNWKDGVRKVKLYRDSDGKPTEVKIKSYDRLSPESGERKKVFKLDDPGFEKAVEFAEKVEKDLKTRN